MKKSFCVAGHIFSVIAPDGFDWSILSNYSVFSVEDSVDELFSLELVDSLPEVRKSLVYTSQENPEETRLDVYTCDGGYYVEVAPSSAYPMSGSIAFDSDYRYCRVLVCDKDRERFVIDNAAMMMYAFATSARNTLLMHSSVVVSEGKAYMFIAPSGTGKSTHSKMWLQNIQDTRLLNDDNPVVSVNDGKIICYGSPWSGKTRCYKNEFAPVGAIVEIKRNSENSAERLEILNAYISLMSATSGLKCDPVMGDGLHSTMEKVVSKVPFFAMHCRPDAEAALVCAAAAKGAHICTDGISHCAIPNDILLPEVERLLSEGHQVVLMAKGFSMLPFIIGDRDSVKLEKKSSCAVGDIVLAKVQNRYVLHRIRVMNPDGNITLMGDGNLRGTESCAVSDICGTVMEIHKPRKTVVPGKAGLWGYLLPVRRYLLYVFRHFILPVI